MCSAELKLTLSTQLADLRCWPIRKLNGDFSRLHRALPAMHDPPLGNAQEMERLSIGLTYSKVPGVVPLDL